MKNYDEIAKSVLARRDAHAAAVARRHRVAVRVGIPVVSLCLAALVGVGFRQAELNKLPSPEVEDAVIPGIDDTVDPDETETDVFPPVPGGAITEPAVENGTAAGNAYGDEPTKETEKRQDECPPEGDEIWIEPHWAEKALYTKYPEFDFGGTRYTTAATWIDADKLGSAMGSAIAKGYDIYEEINYEMGVSVYPINGISADAAVAVSYDGFEGRYAVYTDHWYKPDTLGEFIDALSLRENLTFNTVYHTFFEYESYMTVEYKIADPAVIWNMLLSDGSLVNVADDVTDKEMSYYKESMSIGVNVDIFGIKNVSLAVTENGYISTNILATRKLFYIGEDKAQEFFKYVEENFESVREDKLATTTAVDEPQYPEDVVVTAVTQTMPPYDPTNEAIIPE